jgi:hypothetical protein
MQTGSRYPSHRVGRGLFGHSSTCNSFHNIPRAGILASNDLANRPAAIYSSRRSSHPGKCQTKTNFPAQPRNEIDWALGIFLFFIRASPKSGFRWGTGQVPLDTAKASFQSLCISSDSFQDRNLTVSHRPLLQIASHGCRCPFRRRWRPSVRSPKPLLTLQA